MTKTTIEEFICSIVKESRHNTEHFIIRKKLHLNENEREGVKEKKGWIEEKENGKRKKKEKKVLKMIPVVPILLIYLCLC